MALQVTAIMLGVRDLARAKKFYGDGLGCTIDKDYPGFVSLSLGDGSSSLALYEWDAAARDAGVPPARPGSRGHPVARPETGQAGHTRQARFDIHGEVLNAAQPNV